MKGIKCLMATALAVIAAGCAKEQVSPGIEDGQEVIVSYNIAAPQGLVTKAISDGQSAKNLTVAVYDSEKNHIATLDQTATFSDLKATVEFHLVKGKTYNFIFWAQSESTAYTLDKDNKVVKISYDGVANDESRDAFFATRELKVTGALSETVGLYRPFAQVNFGTADFEAAKKAGVEPTKSTLTATEAATELDLFGREGKVSNGASSDIAYTEEVFPTEELVLSDGTEYKYLSMNYFIPVGSLDEQHVSDLKATFTGGADPVEISVPSAPVQANYRTNIVGNLLTDQVIFNIEIKPAYDGEENIDLENITSAVALNALFLNGGSAKLAENIEFADAVTVPAGKYVVLDLNGHSITNKGTNAAIFVNGDLTVNGEGTVEGGEGGNNIAIQVNAGGNLTINGGTYNVGADAEGLGNSTIYSFGGNVTITDGTFSSAAKWSNRYWVINKKNGTTGVVKISGGKYFEFDPADPTTDDDDSYLADGYKSTKVGDYYIVTAADVTPVADQESLNAAVAVADSKIQLAAGEYTIPSSCANNVTIQGTEGTIINCPSAVAYHGVSLILKNLTLKYPSVNDNGIQHAASIIYDNCVIEGRMTSYATTATFYNCTFNQSIYDYSIWTYGSEDITFNNCKFNCAGKAVKIYIESWEKEQQPTATFNKCTFTATNVPETANKAALTIDSRLLPDGVKFHIFANDCTVSGFAETPEFGGTSLWDVEGTKAEVTVDGVKAYPTE